MRTTENGVIILDGIDKIIIQSLMNDAKKPIHNIAKEVGVSITAIHQRIKKLEQSGLLENSKTIVNTKKLGYNTVAFIGIFLDKSSHYKEAIKALEKIKEVTEAHYTTGNYSVFIKLICKDNEHLLQVLNKEIQNIKGIIRTETFISLEQSIYRQIQP